MLESNSSKAQIWKPFRSFLKFIGNFRHLLLPLIGIYLPLMIFVILALQVWQGQVGFLFPWDVPILMAIHQTVQPRLDAIALFITQFGGLRGSLPIFGTIGLILILGRQWRSFVFLATTGFGNVIINRTAKEFMHRVRPHLWDSTYHSHGYAFPSGHSMTSMTIAAVFIILAWKTTLRIPAIIFGSLFVLAIAWTRLYLGVHYPSDILAGWMVALAWVTGVSSVVKPNLAATNYETTLLPEEVEQVEQAESGNEA